MDILLRRILRPVKGGKQGNSTENATVSTTRRNYRCTQKRAPPKNEPRHTHRENLQLDMENTRIKQTEKYRTPDYSVHHKNGRHLGMN